jgi:thymidine kinase
VSEPGSIIDATDALSSAGSRRCTPQTGRIRWYFGPMDCGKSTLALQIDHNQARQGRHGLVLVRHDRSGRPQISSRIGISRQATEVADDADLRLLVRSRWAAGQRVDYLVVDEAQFLSAEQVEQLAELADDSQVDVYCFGIATDFRSRLFPGARRLFELADELHPVQVEVLCWCGLPGRFNARVSGGRVIREGDTVMVADTDHLDEVRYQVLCRRHFRVGELAQDPVSPQQLSLT